MILQELVRYYERLVDDPEQDIPEFGCIKQGVAFEIVLHSDGSLEGIHDLRITDDSKTRNKMMTLPGKAKPSGSGMNPTPYGWDRTDYMLGYLNPETLKPGDREKVLQRCEKAHESFKELYRGKEPDINNDDYSSFCHFLEKWNPQEAKNYPILAEISGLFGVVRFCDGPPRYLHDITALREEQKTDEPWVSRCLVTGDITEIARIQDIKTKGVNGAQSSGASLVSFNADAFCSYGKDQSFNAPIGETASFEFSTALNKLLESESERRIKIGDATCVFWADEPGISEDIFKLSFSYTPAEDEEKTAKVRSTLKSLVSGTAPLTIEKGGFYVLGLSPNAARLSVRFWYRGTVEEMVGRVVRHQKELEIIKGERDREILPIWILLAQTARESKDIPPLLGGALTRSILWETRYPDSFYSAVLRRIRADKEITYPRAAIIKAFLQRNYEKEELFMLDENRPEVAYQLGRLFASLEKTQLKALGNINASIKDRYYGAASSTPATVFPRLIRMSQHHIGKLEGGQKVFAEKTIQEICGRIQNFPKHLNLADQGLFSLGYYHQRQDFFTPKTEKKEGNNE